MVEFRIGSKGVLLVEAESPGAHWVDQEVYWVEADGSHTDLPVTSSWAAYNARERGHGGAEACCFQYGLHVDDEGEELRFFSFLVGELKKKDGFPGEREKLEEQALKLCRSTASSRM
jgi:hypothetical protein